MRPRRTETVNLLGLLSGRAGQNGSISLKAGGRPVAAGFVHTVYKARALKAEILHVRRQGYAFISQELELGLCSIAVPIRSATGQAVCGLNVSMRYSDDVETIALKKMLPALKSARQSIEEAMARGGWQPLTVSRNAHD